MGRFVVLLFFLVVVISCDKKVCEDSTPLVKVGSDVFSAAYLKTLKSTLPKWVVDRFYSGEKGNEQLLEKLVERQLVVRFVEDKGLFGDRERKKLCEFEIEQLAGLYVNSRVGDYKVSDRELEEYIKKHLNKKLTEKEKKFLRVNLEARRFQKKREEVEKRVEKQIDFRNNGDVVAVFRGKEIKKEDLSCLLRSGKAPDIKKAVLKYALYLKALEKGLDKDLRFKVLYQKTKESLAAKAFENYLLSKVKVTDEEVKNYYREHKSEFKKPARAVVTVYEVNSRKEAKELISSGKFVNLKGKRWQVLEKDASKNPVARVVFKEGKNRAIIDLPNGKTLVVIVNKRFPAKELPLGDVYSSIVRKLKRERVLQLYHQKLKELKSKYGVVYYRENFECLKKL